MSLNRIYTNYSVSSPSNHPLFISKEAAAGFASILNSSIGQAQPQPSTGLDGIFEAAAREYNVPVNLLKAVAKVESNFRPNATSRCGAMGVMQLMPRTAAWLGVKDAYDPEQNIMGGAKYLSKLLKQYDGNLELTLAAYNAGPGTVRKYGGTVPPFAQGYVNKVMRNIVGDISTGSNATSIATSSFSGSKSATESDVEGPAQASGSEAESLPSLLLLKIMSEMQLLKAIDGDQEPGNALYPSGE